MQARKQTLVELIQSEKLSNQAAVVAAMQKRGIPVTQPSISRDFKELGVVKAGGRYVVASDLSAEITVSNEGSLDLIKTALAVGENLVVVKTRVAAGSIVASALDAKNYPGVVGTVAGDDTIFIAVENANFQQSLIEELVS